MNPCGRRHVPVHERRVVEHGVEQRTEHPDREAKYRQPDGQVQTKIFFRIESPRDERVKSHDNESSRLARFAALSRCGQVAAGSGRDDPGRCASGGGVTPAPCSFRARRRENDCPTRRDTCRTPASRTRHQLRERESHRPTATPSNSESMRQRPAHGDRDRAHERGHRRHHDRAEPDAGCLENRLGFGVFVRRAAPRSRSRSS